MTETPASDLNRPHYRPFTLARAGEVLAYKDLSPTSHAGITPIFVVPAREWDYDNETFAKSIPAHLAEIPKKLHAARGNRAAYIDLSLLDDEGPIHNQHPLTWLVTEAQKLGLLLMPLVHPGSSMSLLAAARALHALNGRGIGLRLNDRHWPGINQTEVRRLMVETGIGESTADLFLDFEDKFSPFVTAAVQNEMHSAATTSWRSITVGGHGWPKTLPAGQGSFVLPRAEWDQYATSYRGLSGKGMKRPDFFDHLIANPEVVLDIDPKLLTISSTFRYTAEPSWVFVRGGLYKAAANKGKGGASVPPTLQLLKSHALYGTPIRTNTETWIENAIVGGPSGNPMSWRRWATYRHVEVTLHALANSL